MPGGELQLTARQATVLSEVAGEMSEIFERAGLASPAADARGPSAVSALRPSRGGGSMSLLLTAAAAGLVGLGAGAFVIRAPAPLAPNQVKAEIQPQPLPKPQDTVTQPTTQPSASPPVALTQADPAPPVAQPAPVRVARPVTATPVPVRAQARREQFRAKLARLDGALPAEARPTIRLREPQAPVAQPASCDQDSGGEDCRVAVVQADRHLRVVYQNAIRRGVSRDTLEDYRNRWADLRDRQTENPSRLIESYGALAYDLGRESADDSDEPPRARPRSGLKALADLLLPWR